MKIKLALVFLLIVRSSFSFGQNIELSTGYCINELIGKEHDGHDEASFSATNNFTFGIGIDSIRIDWLNIRFNLSFDRYSGF